MISITASELADNAGGAQLFSDFYLMIRHQEEEM